MRALRPNSGQPDFQGGQSSEERLLISWHEVLHSPGGTGNRRVVDVLWRFKVIPNPLEVGL